MPIVTLVHKLLTVWPSLPLFVCVFETILMRVNEHCLAVVAELDCVHRKLKTVIIYCRGAVWRGLKHFFRCFLPFWCCRIHIFGFQALCCSQALRLSTVNSSLPSCSCRRGEAGLLHQTENSRFVNQFCNSKGRTAVIIMYRSLWSIYKPWQLS